MNNSVSTPLVTIAIPSYNHGQYIQDAIKSALNQSYENIELIIIDDGSTDNSIEKIKELLSQCEERFVRFEFRHRANRGLCNTLNEAIEWAKGQFFCTLASDDIMFPEKTSLQLEAFQLDQEIVCICGGNHTIDSHNQTIKVNVNDYGEYKFHRIFMHRFDLPASSQMIRTDILREVGGFNPNTKVEDWDLWLKLSKLGKKIIYIPHALIGYRSHENNISKNLELMHSEVIKVVNQYKNEPDYAKAVYRIQKKYKVRPYQKKNPFKALVLRLKYYLIYLTSK
ncbi:glycosyltransferase family 2 protein [Acinetobacter beijerinckii]|uniref:glycosyltransferase family 2 protein n=1 Tax=Acinetobacter beijerinckii TaxID=262668 RepID=UPI003AF95966